MINAIRAEWVKFRSVRSTLILLAMGGVITVVIALALIADYSGDEYREAFNLTDISAGSTIAVYLFGTLGVQIIGQEYRFNTIRATFSANPNRIQVLLAKMVVVSATVAVVALLMQLVCVALGSAFLGGFEMDSVDTRTIWGTALFAIGWTLLGLGVGAIIRQPVAGIVILLVWGAVVEGIIGSIFDWTHKWLPFTNGSQMSFRNESAGQEGTFDVRGPLEGGIYFFIVVTVILVIGAYLTHRRDA